MSMVGASHVWLDERGVAWIDDTNLKVIEVALDKIAHGLSAEEIHFQYPHLSLAQIYAALAFYHDYQDELDAQIESRFETASQMASANADSPFRQRLRKLGKIQ